MRIGGIISSLTLAQKGLVIVAVPVVAELAFVVALLSAQQAADLQFERELQFRTVAAETMSMNLVTQKAISRLVIFAVTGEKAAIESFDKLLEDIPSRVLVVKSLYLSSKQSDLLMQKIEAATGKITKKLAEYRQLCSSTEGKQISRQEWLLVVKETGPQIEALSRDLSELIDLQRKADLPSEAAAATRRWRNLVILFGFFANVGIAIWLGVFFWKQISGRLGVLTDNTLKLSREEALHPPLEGADEIGRLDSFFHKMAEELARTNRHKEEILSMVSHDLRAPLSSLNLSMGMLEEMEYDALTPYAQKQVKQGNKTLRRMVSLVNDLLDLDKLKTGKFDLELDAVSVAEVVEQITAELDQFSRANKVSVAAAACDFLVIADRERLAQVFANLLSNAIKFSPPDTTVKVWAQSSEASPAVIRLNVQDSGPGVPLEYRERIFLPFEQSPATRGRAKAGTGLGLPICKRIVELHGGTLGLDCPPEGGSRFWFELPEAEIEG